MIEFHLKFYTVLYCFQCSFSCAVLAQALWGI